MTLHRINLGNTFNRTWLIAMSLLAGIATGAPSSPAAQENATSTMDVSTRRLLDALEERQMPDVALWVLNRIEATADASSDIKKDVPYRRAIALVGTTRTESDSKKRAAILDQAEKEIDRFLDDKPGGAQAIAAYTQKGNLLVERGRSKIEQAKRPDQDVKALQAESLQFFDNAIKSLEGAEGAASESLKKVDADLAEMKEKERKAKEALEAAEPAKPKGAKAKPDAKKTPALSSADVAAMDLLEEKQDSLRGQLLQARLLIAGVLFEKSKALEKDSKEWKQAIEDSTKKYGDLFQKYSSRGVGLFARYYEGRNYVVLGDRVKALAALSNLRLLEGEAGIVPSLRTKAINSSLECWLEEKKYEEFDERLQKIALTSVPPAKLDADWLGMKYRAAVLLERRASELADGEKPKRIAIQKDAKKLALEVAKANRDFSKEARDLLAHLENKLPEDQDGSVASFKEAMDAARLLLTTMQSKQAEAKQAELAGKTDEVEAAAKEITAGRIKIVEAIRKAMPLAEDADLDGLNQARYLLTFLMYDSKQLHAAAALGTFLAERYPNSKGSRQAAKIAMASWQQLQKQEVAAWRVDAKTQCMQLAERIMGTWPDDSESADAALIAIASETESQGVDSVLSIIKKLPAQSPRRSEVLLRAGGAMWRKVLEKRRLEQELRPTDKELAEWRLEAAKAIDEGLRLLPEDAAASPVSISAALARCQMAMESGDDEFVAKTLEHPKYGPWTFATGKDVAILGGPLLESTLSVALRYFIQSEQLVKAQQAMDKLESVAGEGEEASAKLTGMYLLMGRDLQAQLENLGAGDGAGSPESKAKAAAILGGFEKFLDGVAKRDPKVSSQIWVATTYLTLGSGKGTGAIASKDKAAGYLAKAAAVYEELLKKGGDEITKFEPSIRLKMSNLYREREKWDEAQKHIDWILEDLKRQNSLEVQTMAAELLQVMGEKTVDKAKADDYLKQAIAGRKNGKSVTWGWGGIANKLSRQAFSGNDEKVLKLRNQFFTARLNITKCRLVRAELAGANSENSKKILESAFNDIVITYKLYPELGGNDFRKQFNALMEKIQKAQGVATTGLTGLDKAAKDAADAAAAGASTAAKGT